MKDFAAILKENSISHEFTSPYTPEQNGRVERNWQTAFNMARCMIIDSGLPKSLWTAAVALSGYVRNRCFSSRVDATPYERFFGKKPNISHMVPFGTKCYVYIEGNKKKLDDRAKRGAFIGYDGSSPAYLIYDSSTGAIVKSRNVRFDNTNDQRAPTDAESCDEDSSDEMPQDDKSSGSSVAGHNNAHEQKSPTKGVDNVINGDNQPPESAMHKEMLRRAQRKTKQPSYLEDYVTNISDEANMNIDYCYRLATGCSVPKTYEEAMASPNAMHWKAAMDREIQSLQDNNTWIVESIPNNQNVIDGKWVYNVKMNNHNEIVKYKARYVARGFSQISGLDFNETFAPTARLTTIRLLMQIVVECNMYIHKMDV